VTITHAERDLWTAVIIRAVHDLIDEDETYGQEARAWFESTEQHIGSFFWVCYLLGLEPTALRRHLNEVEDISDNISAARRTTVVYGLESNARSQRSKPTDFYSARNAGRPRTQTQP